MKRVLFSRAVIVLPAFVITVILELFMTQTSHADTIDRLRSKLPAQVMGWTSEAQDHIYDDNTIFSYIDGGAEVYRAYNMRRCLSRRYTTPNGPAIVLDIFDMGFSQDAYGVFTHDTEGQIADIGQDGRYRPGWLSFWKDRFFVSIYVEEETPAGEKAVRELGKLVDARITGRGARPKILQKLPAKDLQPESIKYLHHPMILNYHYYLSDENILKISPRTDAVLARYRSGIREALLLLVIYPKADSASEAHTGLLKHYLADADQTGVALLENKKWSAAIVNDRLLAVVLESDSRSLAENILKNVK